MNWQHVNKDHGTRWRDQKHLIHIITNAISSSMNLNFTKQNQLCAQSSNWNYVQMNQTFSFDTYNYADTAERSEKLETHKFNVKELANVNGTRQDERLNGNHVQKHICRIRCRLSWPHTPNDRTSDSFPHWTIRRALAQGVLDPVQKHISHIV